MAYGLSNGHVTDDLTCTLRELILNMSNLLKYFRVCLFSLWPISS